MRRVVLSIISLLALSLTLAAIGIIGYRVVLAASSRLTPEKSSYYPSDWLANTNVPLPTPTIPFGLAWKRTGGLANVCGQLSLVDSTETRYSTCGQGSIVAELTTEEYRQYLYYLGHYAPFSYSFSDDSGISSVWLGFGGRGENQATQEEESNIAAWTEAVYLRFKQEERQASIVAVVRLALAAHLGISADEISTEYVEAMNWPNACLGLSLPGVDCARVRTAGYQIILVTNGVRYEYRTNLYDVHRLAGSSTLTPTPVPVTASPIPVTPLPTHTIAPSATTRPSVTASPTATPSKTTIPSPTATSTPTATASPTATPSPTATASPTATPSPTVTASPTATSSPTTTHTATATVSLTPTSSATATASPTVTPIPSATASPTATPSLTATINPTPSPTATNTPMATSSPTVIASPTATPDPTATASPTPLPASSDSPTSGARPNR
ncbi:MAG: hypothetical protein ACYCZF_14230 [Anaerolineae bacterium]